MVDRPTSTHALPFRGSTISLARQSRGVGSSYGSMLLLRLVRVRLGLLYFLLGVAAWVALQASVIEPVVLGLAVGLLTSAYAPARGDLERATDLFRLFREQPTPSLPSRRG
jgi:Na+/H+ antiporter NhaA